MRLFSTTVSAMRRAFGKIRHLFFTGATGLSKTHPRSHRYRRDRQGFSASYTAPRRISRFHLSSARAFSRADENGGDTLELLNRMRPGDPTTSAWRFPPLYIHGHDLATSSTHGSCSRSRRSSARISRCRSLKSATTSASSHACSVFTTECPSAARISAPSGNSSADSPRPRQ